MFGLFTAAFPVGALLSWRRWRRLARPFADRLVRRMRHAATAGGPQRGEGQEPSG